MGWLILRGGEGDDGLEGFVTGSISTLSGEPPKGWAPPPRAFPPGFHGAAPGPSHPEPEAPRKSRKP